MLLLDFETKSEADLTAVGTDAYCRHPSTDILCMAATDTETDQEWLWYPGDLPPHDLVASLKAQELVGAHNARFDKGIYENVAAPKYGFPILPRDKWYCTSAQCRVNALPGGLDDAARAIDPKYRKDHRGSALIRECSIPPFNTDPELLRQMGEYCLQDVRLCAHIVRNTRPLTAQEHADWLINEQINDRGVCIDRELAELAVQYAAQEQAEIGDLLSEITGGVITKHTQHQRVKAWLAEKLEAYDPTVSASGTDPIRLITRYKDGQKKISTDKSAREALLAAQASHEIFLPDELVEVIELVNDGSRSSVAKFGKMLSMADPVTDRVTGALIWAGAGQTKRFSSKGLQVHNFRRDCFKPDECDALFWAMEAGEPLENCMDTLGKLLRPAIWPDEDKAFVVTDWSAIEGRALPWLSDDPRAEPVLNIFRGDGRIYEHTASGIFGIPMDAVEEDSRERFIGKVATLALGYQGAVGAFNSMARNYGLFLPEHEVVRIVSRWRVANPWAVDFWAKLERAAMRAVQRPGQRFPAGRVSYVYTPKLLGGTLFCELPGGEFIQYSGVRIEKVATPWGEKPAVTYLKASVKPAADSDTWPRASLYGGLLAENVTQAFCACLLRNALAKLKDVVLHVHDETVQEVDEEHAAAVAAETKAIMETAPEWAAGLPLKAAPKVMYRYGK